MNISFDVPEDILHSLLDVVPIPPMARIRNEMQTPAGIVDIEGAVVGALRQSGVKDTVNPGARLALAVGSRGIDRLAEIVTALVGELKAWGAEPFVIPAMGSHGGATAEGQRSVLAHLGVVEERIGAPIESQMDTVVVGETEDGQ